MSRMFGVKKLGRSSDIEPVLGENDDMMDLRFVFEDKNDLEKAGKINSMVTLQIGEWV